MRRIQTEYILQDLQKKMVFITGPRQVGKTFLAKNIASYYKNPVYLNYDSLADRQIMQNLTWLDTTDLLILDELHKMPDWKNYIKGVYDTKLPQLHILVTGSARLDTFNKFGDSLAGRYFAHRLLPLSPAELTQLHERVDLTRLMQRGGFPEPYLADTALDANRWRLQYTDSILATDVFDFDKIQNIKALRTIFALLKTKVGSPVSYQSLAEDAAVSPSTVKKYIEILEALYIIFRITPFSNNIARSLLKEPKIYFFDNGIIPADNPGAQLENLVALCLLKHVYAKIDYYAENYALHYLRTKDGDEVDFALAQDGKITTIIEVKNSDPAISKSLRTFSSKYSLPAIQIVHNLRQEYIADNNIKVIKAINFLADLLL